MIVTNAWDKTLSTWIDTVKDKKYLYLKNPYVPTLKIHKIKTNFAKNQYKIASTSLSI